MNEGNVVLHRITSIHKIGSYNTLKQTTILAKYQANIILINSTLSNSTSPTSVTCIWENIQKVHYNSPKIFNFNYIKIQDIMLKSSSAIKKIKLKRYYARESLCTGPVHDLD